MAYSSWAQNYEDVMLARALKDVVEGFYIDVGACDPTLHSVTKHFYDLGWSGINIEPSAIRIEKFKKERVRDINLELLISDEVTTLDYYEEPNGGLSTSVDQIAQSHERIGITFKKLKKKSSTLSDVIEKNAQGREIHFLKIDVEGFEKKVLAGAELDKNRPWIIVIESTEPLTQIDNFEVWEFLLLENGYIHGYSDGLNRFYVSQERKELLNYFKFPKNVFDDFCQVYPGELVTLGEYQRLTEENQRLTGDYQRVAGEYQRVAGEYQRVAGEYQRVAGENQRVAGENQRVAGENQRLTGENQRVAGEYQRVAGEYQRVAGEISLIRGSRSWKLVLFLRSIYTRIRIFKLHFTGLIWKIRNGRQINSLKKFENLKIEDLVPNKFLSLRYDKRPNSQNDWMSEIVSERRFKERNYFLWMDFLKEKPKLHSKQFQYYAIMEAANDVLGNLETNKSAIGFGVGVEPIPAGLGRLGFQVTATDFLEGEIASAWFNTSQLAASAQDLNTREILSAAEFNARVSFKSMDMNNIPESFENCFDFVWSTCALGHIGGYQKGLDFIFNSAKLLRPGGIALHTTELDMSPNSDRFDSPNLSFYKIEDILELKVRLEGVGFEVADLNIPESWTNPSERYVVTEPWGDKPHIRIRIFDREILSLVLRIRRHI
jgi:FkbM family methyltransferase